jgi:hypothetical protein
VVKVKDMYDRYGNPAYLMRYQEVTAVDVPDELRGG